MSDSRLKTTARLCAIGAFHFSVIPLILGWSAFLAFPGFVSSGYGFDSYQTFEKSKKRNPPLQLEAVPDREQVHPGEIFSLHLVTFLEEGWHMYSLEKQSEDETVATRIELKPLVFDPRGSWRETPPRLVRDEVMEKIMKTHSGRAEFTHLFSVPERLEPGVYPLAGILHFRTCDNHICTLPQSVKFQTRVIVKAGKPG